MQDWITPDQWDPATVKKAKYAKCNVGNPGKKRSRKIKDVLCAFDIETSHVPDRQDACLYHWQLQIGLDTPTIHGRTWDDLRLMISRILDALGETDKLVWYVHNLSFEWQHLLTVYPFQQNEVYATGSRKILKATMYDGAIELRCSYLLTNMGLGAWTKKMAVEHPKLDSEAYDHQQIRYPWTELTDQELLYCRHDVLGLVEALKVQMDRDHDTLETIPLTSTGYLRRDVKKVMRAWSYWGLQNVQPSLEVYKALREEFRGGDTHGSRFFVGDIVKNVRSMDRSSSYPDVLVNCRFPMSKFRPWVRRSEAERKRLLKLDMALLMRVRIHGLRLRKITLGDPPLSFSKCRRVINHSLDNGRILRADMLETTITDIDFRIYEQAYVWDEIEYLACWYSAYDWLPKPLRDLIILYYKRKTELKGVEGQELFYDLAKALLNSTYGLQAQDNLKWAPWFDGQIWHPTVEELAAGRSDEELEAMLQKQRHKAYGSYAWGCWTTSWARLRLWEGLYGDGKPGHKGVGRDFVYCDTDSIKFIGDHDISWYNDQRIRDSKASGAWARDPSGQIHYMGVFEVESTADRFITWGAKKYAYEDHKGLHLTVAGVGKRSGAAFLADHGGLDVFKPGLVFPYPAGGTNSIYRDETRGVITVDGHQLELGPNIYIEPSTYKLSPTPEYYANLEDPEVWIEFLSDSKNFENFETDVI